jgi:acyl-CoA thioesterase YciA
MRKWAGRDCAVTSTIGSKGGDDGDAEIAPSLANETPSMPDASTPSTKPSAPRMPTAEPAIRTIAMPADTNPAGDIFGGWLMCQMDLAAGNAAAKISRGRCVTIAVEGMIFLSPVRVGDEVTVWAELIRRGRSSMTFEVSAWRRPRDGYDYTCVTHASFTFVALDAEGRPRKVPDDGVINA